MRISKRTGKRLSGRRMEQIVLDIMQLAVLDGKGYPPHKLRHTAALLMHQAGSANILERKLILGYESLPTTEVYMHSHER